MAHEKVPHFNYQSHMVQILNSRELYPRQRKFTNSIKSDPYIVKRFATYKSLKGHTGCVNTVSWNQAGNIIVSGSDDCRINIWSPFEHHDSPLLHSIPSGHNANIFSARFMTNTGDRHIVSCANDGIVKFTDVNKYIETSASSNWNPSPSFNCHSGRTYEVLPDPADSNVFFDCSDDGRINQYDLRIRTSCDCDQCNLHTLLDLNQTSGTKHEKGKTPHNTSSCATDRRDGSERQSQRLHNTLRSRLHNMKVTGISIRPDYNIYLAAACSDDTVRIYDRRFIPSLDTGYHRDAQVYTFIPNCMKHNSSTRSEAERRFEPLHHRMTCIKYDPNGGGDLIVSYSREKVYLIRPGAGKIGKSGKARKGGVSVVRKGKASESLDSTDQTVDMKIDSTEESLDNEVEMDITTNNQDIVPRWKTQDKETDTKGPQINLPIVKGEQDTIPTSPDMPIDLPIIKGEQDTIPTSSDMDQSSKQNSDQSGRDALPEATLLNGMEEDEINEDFETEYDDNICSSDEEEDISNYGIEEGDDEDIVRTYEGHRNEKTMIKKANFFGSNSEYIMSGSDDRRIFVWEKSTGRVVNLLVGDEKVVNCVQPHPFFPILCTSGIDDDVKIWHPCAEEENDISNLQEVIEANKRSINDMEGRVIMVPADRIFLQMLAMLNESGAIFSLNDSSDDE